MTYTVIGTTDEQTVCDNCGRTELKMTVVLRTDDGDIVKYGRTCAARVTGWKAANLNRNIAAAAPEVEHARYIVSHWQQFRGQEGAELFIERNPQAYKHNMAFGDVVQMIEDTIAKYAARLEGLAA